MSQVLVIDGHPHAASLCAALAQAHAEGVREGGATATVLALRDLRFDPILRAGYNDHQPLEPDLQQAQALVDGARRIVVVAPVWWGSIPALLKGFFDRVLERGWAFRYLPNGRAEGLLAGRSARVIMTTDSPGYYLRLIQGDPTAKALVRSTLRFCGLAPVDMTRIGPVHRADEGRRERWLAQVRAQGRDDAAKRLAMPSSPARARSSSGAARVP
jgi:NAD(P)H dehydrogenase (quinone)